MRKFVDDDELVAAYGTGYLDWKSWGDEGFAALSSSTARYYDAEMVRAGIGTESRLQILEVGFGNGDFLTYARNRGWNVIGTEMISDLVDLARAAGFDARDASALANLPDASLDLVMAMDVIEHIPTEDIVPFLGQVLRMLRPGGRFVAHFPNGDSPFGLFYQNGDATHVNAIGAQKATYYANKVGAEIMFLGGEARPIFAGSFPHAAQRIVAWPFKTLVNLAVRYIFLPGSKIDFCAPALTMILRKPL
jgi:SAM-dependent methyltransferase